MPGFPLRGAMSSDPTMAWIEQLLRQYGIDPNPVPAIGRAYSEGQQIPGPRNWLMEQERGAFAGPQREDELNAALGRGRWFGPSGGVMPDAIPNAWLEGNYPGPGRYPWALY